MSKVGGIRRSRGSCGFRPIIMITSIIAGVVVGAVPGCSSRTNELWAKLRRNTDDHPAPKIKVAPRQPYNARKKMDVGEKSERASKGRQRCDRVAEARQKGPRLTI